MSQENEEEEEHEASFAASFSEPNIGSTFVDSKRRSFFEHFLDVAAACCDEGAAAAAAAPCPPLALRQ